MKKFKLQIDDLAVDTFATDGTGASFGTVRGNESYTVDTNCFGECVTGSISGCDGCNPTPECTGDIHDFYCHNSENFCDPTVQFTSCAENC